MVKKKGMPYFLHTPKQLPAIPHFSAIGIY